MDNGWLKENFQRLYDRVDKLQDTCNTIKTDLAILKNDKRWAFRISATMGGLFGILSAIVINLILN